MQKQAKRVKQLDGKNVKFIKQDNQNQFLVTKKGKLWARGRNLIGELGVGDGGSTDEWKPVEGLEGKKVINLWNFDGITFVCTADGDLYASGYNPNGELGVGDRITRDTFSPVQGLEGSYVVDVLRDQFFMWKTLFFLTQDGRIFRKGRNELTYEQALEVEATITWMRSCFGSIFACTENGKLFTCGRNMSGSLGVGDKVERETFVPVLGIPSKHAIDQLELELNGSVSVYALTREGFLYTWGNNQYGQLGHEHREAQWVPKEVTTTHECDYEVIYKGIYERNTQRPPIFKGRFHTIRAYKGSVYAVTLEGALFVCGRNKQGQLGLGDKILRSRLTKVEEINATVLDVIISKKGLFVKTTQGDSYKLDLQDQRFKKVQALQASHTRFNFDQHSVGPEEFQPRSYDF